MKNGAAACRLSLALIGVLAGLGAQAQEPPVTIRSSAQEVALDLVVRDAHGRLVKNLRASEVEILEDGVPQEIRSFKLVSGRAAVQSQATEAAPAPAAPAASPLPAVNVVCIVFHKLDVNTRKFAVEAAQEFLRSQLPPGAWIGIFNLDSTLSTLHPFSTNREELIASAAGAATGTGTDFMSTANAVLSSTPTVATVVVTTSGNPASGGSVSTALTVSGGELNTEAITGVDVSNGTGEKILRGQRAIQRRQFGWIEGMHQTDQVFMMIDEFRRLPGRKTVLLFSSGLATTGDPERFDSLISKANQANITLYSIDVNGLTQNSNVVAGNSAVRHAGSLGRSSNVREQMLQDDYLHDAVRTTDLQATLRTLAEGTGGFLIGNTNDLRKPFQQVLADLDTHYEVIYHPSAEKYDGRFRNIAVKPSRPGLVVQSRAGYFALPALPGVSAPLPFEVAALNALNAQTQPHAFDFKSAALQFRPGADGLQCAIAMELPSSSVGATPLPELKKHRVHISFFALVKDSSGQVVDMVGQDSPYEVPDADLAALKASPLTFTHPIDLPLGRYTVESVILDHEAHRASTAKLEFDNPGHKGIALSSIVLVRRVESTGIPYDPSDPLQLQLKTQEQSQAKTSPGRIVPELTATLEAGARPSVYFVVYPDSANAERPKLWVEFRVDGEVVAKRVSDLGPVDSTGAVPLILAAATHPGVCELRVTALQGGDFSTQTLRYTIPRQ